MDKCGSKTSLSIRQALLDQCDERRRQIAVFIRDTVRGRFRREGVVIGISGGIDSAVVAALAVEALGSDRVYGLVLPEKESSPSSRELGIDLCRTLEIPCEEVSITPMLEAFGVYSGKEALIRQVFPRYDPSRHTTSLFRPPVLGPERVLNIPSLALLEDRETVAVQRLSAPQFFHLLSLQNAKQRTRMIVEYMRAEAMNYAVCGTTNRTELQLGFYVKYGDGGVDLEPLADCYKAQVYGLAELLGIDPRIVARPPSPDTWSHFSSDEEVALRMPYDILDQLLFAEENRLSPEMVRAGTGLDPAEIEWGKRHILSLKNAARTLEGPPPSCTPDGSERVR